MAKKKITRRLTWQQAARLREKLRGASKEKYQKVLDASDSLEDTRLATEWRAVVRHIRNHGVVPIEYREPPGCPHIPDFGGNYSCVDPQRDKDRPPRRGVSQPTSEEYPPSWENAVRALEDCVE